MSYTYSYQNRLVEGVLRDFPRMNTDLQAWREYAIPAAVSPSGEELGCHVGGGVKSYQQERYCSLLNGRNVRNLEKIVETIYSAYCSLPDMQRRVVALRYWRDCSFDDVAAEIPCVKRTAFRAKASALKALLRPCLEVINLIEDWRERERVAFEKLIAIGL